MALREELHAQGEFLFRRRGYLPVVGLAVYVLALPQSERIELAYGDLVDDVFDWFCVAVSALGLAARVCVAGTVPKRTSGRNRRKGQVAQELNTTGAYSVVRHPLYVANFLIFLGICLAPGAVWLLLSGFVAYWIYYERIAFAEEEFLRARFGAAFEAWAAITPAFVPDPRRFRPAALEFSARTALKREYQTIAATAVGFCAIDYAEDLARGETASLAWEPETTALALVASLLFLLVRYLRKHTRLLTVAGR